jgi:hypothetical protein
VNWDTTKKTTGFTAVSGVGYFCDTSGGAFTMTLPATPSAGNIVALKDYANTFDTNNLTIGRNGSNINGFASNAVISVQGQALTLIYIDATQGWSAIYGATDADLPTPQFVAATGGTIATCGNYKIHTFTGPGTFTVTDAGNASGSNKVDYLVVAGGGGSNGQYAGGAGGGGFRESVPSPAAWTASPLANPGGALPVSAQGYPITVGSGGTNPGAASAAGNPGNNSIFSTITSTGGGGSGAGAPPAPAPSAAGNPGGSGGGAGGYGPGAKSGGSGNSPPVAPPQGNAGGGTNAPCAGYSSAGGGGAGAVGSPFTGPYSPGTVAGAGGNGAQTSISGLATYYAGGGGGGTWGTAPVGAAGGLGGGATGLYSNQPGTATGTANTGGGGGGGGIDGSANNGGSGIVVIRYKFQ